MNKQPDSDINKARFWMIITTILLITILYLAISYISIRTEKGQEAKCFFEKQI